MQKANGSHFKPMKILPVSDGCGLTVHGELNDVPTRGVARGKKVGGPIAIEPMHT